MEKRSNIILGITLDTIFIDTQQHTKRFVKRTGIQTSRERDEVREGLDDGDPSMLIFEFKKSLIEFNQFLMRGLRNHLQHTGGHQRAYIVS